MRAAEIMRVLEEPPDQEEHYGSCHGRGGDDAAGIYAPVLSCGTVVVFVIENPVIALVHPSTYRWVAVSPPGGYMPSVSGTGCRVKSRGPAIGEGQ